MTDKLTELKPCPNCGEEHFRKDHNEDIEFYCESRLLSDGRFVESIHCLRGQLKQAREVVNNLVTTHGEEMGEKCREVLRLRLLVGKVRKYLEQPDTVLKTRGAILFMLDEAEKGKS